MKLEFNMQISFNEEIVLASPFYFFVFLIKQKSIQAIPWNKYHCHFLLWFVIIISLSFNFFNNIYKEVVTQTRLSNSLERLIFENKILLQEFWCHQNTKGK